MKSDREGSGEHDPLPQGGGGGGGRASLEGGEGFGKTRRPLLYPQQDSCLTNEIVQLPV